MVLLPKRVALFTLVSVKSKGEHLQCQKNRCRRVSHGYLALALFRWYSLIVRIRPGVLRDVRRVFTCSRTRRRLACRTALFFPRPWKNAVDRIAVFIDGAYLDYTLRDEFDSARIDYGRFAHHLSGGKEILRTYYYHCLPYQSDPPTAEESDRFSKKQSFISRLDRLPRFTVRLGKLAFRGKRDDGRAIFVQKRVDIMLGVDLVQLSTKRLITTAALVAGDSDFLPAVEIARDEGVVVHLYHGTTNQPHRELWDACDERTAISRDMIDQVRRE